MIRRTLVCVSAILLWGIGQAKADYLEVRRAAFLKVAPLGEAAAIERLTPGLQLALVEENQQNGYYHAENRATGSVGYVYRTFVRRYSGDIESPQSSAPSESGPSGAGSNNLSDYEGDHAFAGYPRAAQSEGLTLLENIGYAVGYSETFKIPLWAAYKCSWVGEATSPGNRPSRFKVDQRTTSRVSHDDYKQSDYHTNPKSYDRGHMAPNFAIGSRYGRDAQLETFVMSNVCPQRSTLNQQTWEALEKQIANSFSFDDGEVWVTVGPILKSSPAKLNGVAAIPEAFYAIIVDDDNGFPRVLAIQMDQDVFGVHPLRPYVTTVDAIESETGLDFLHELPDAIEGAVESEGPDENWRIDEPLVPTRWAN